ncbi:MAG: tyrosine-type recombinase/integrase [Desulfitobacterium sp.]|nr:tyrosine-type recombinase/integrase [Desulfitobacterium sp.]
MECVEPIKDVESIKNIRRVLGKSSQRDLLLFVLGINTGIRISDLLTLKLSDVWEKGQIKEFLCLYDDKREEEDIYYLNSKVREELEKYLASNPLNEGDYLFKSQKDDLPITRQQAYRIINQAARDAGVLGKIGTHTLRKTFGYHAFRAGVTISLLMKIFHHYSPSETLKYIGVDKEETKYIRIDVNL